MRANALKTTLRGVLAVAAMVPFSLTACKHAVDDATLTKNVQSALSGDAVISQQPVQVAVQGGVVTLTGNVSDDTARGLAAQDAAKVDGVKEVVNDIAIAGAAVTPTVTLPGAPTRPRQATHQEREAIAQHQTLPPPPPAAQAPPPPALRTVTVAAGRDIPIRITQSFDSETAQVGMPFTGVVTREIDADGYVAIPAGAAVSGVVIDAKDAAHFKGSSLLSLQLRTVRRRGETLTVSADPYVVEGKGRGANTAEKVGGGAAIGAVLGGIFGGGKGAAIGAAAGGGGGAAVQGFTRGQQVHIASETVIPFRLVSGVTVQSGEEASGEGPSQGLQTR